MIKPIDSFLVSGSQGFIGSHLIEQLLSKSKVIGVNSVLDKRRKHYHPLKKNILNIKLSDIPHDFSKVIHLAAMTDVNYCSMHPQQCIMTNVMGTKKILDLALKKDADFLYVSTSHVYGKPKRLPVSENDPLYPSSVYAASKLLGEAMAESYAKSYGMNVNIVRLFSVYGPKSPPFLVTSKICSQIETKRIRLGNISSKRDFIFIKDAIDAIKIVLRKSKGFNVFNVGTGKSTSIKTICEKLIKISGKRVPLEIDDALLRQNDVPDIFSNNKKLKKLGWSPKIPLDIGLKITYDWHHYKN